MNKIAPCRLRFFIVILVGLGGVTMLPVLQSAGIAPGITSAFADDDDDGDDGGSGGYGGSSGGGDGGDTRRPRGDLRSLFGWPFQRAERRSPPRRTVSIPDRAPGEIVALGLDETTIANLTQDGFVVD